MFLLAWNLLRGRVGRALVAIRDHPIAATAMGINLPMFKSLTFGVSAAFTGVAGALGAHRRWRSCRPTASPCSLSITLLVGVVVGGLASIPGAIFGAIFIQFVPNLADEISKSAPWAIYGVFLIAFMYLMPTGVMGLLRRMARLRRGAPGRPRWPPAPAVAGDLHSTKETSTMEHHTISGSRPLAGRAARWRPARRCAQKKYDPGASDKEIKVGHLNPYSGPASAYGTIGKAIGAYFDKVNAEGGINGRKINFISLDDGYNPAKTVEQARKLVEEEEVLLVFQPLGTPSNSAIHKYMNTKKVPQLFVATGATKWGDPKNFPWTMGWQPNYQSEAKIYAANILENQPNAKIARALPERRLRQGLPQGLRGRPRREGRR